MAENRKSTEGKGTGSGSKKERGSNNLLEALKLVIDENAGLKLRVIQKIKSHLAMRDQTIFDLAQDKKNAKVKKRN